MKKIFAILLSLALVMGLGLATAAPAGATHYPSISPDSATYNLDNPAQVTTTITMGEASTLNSINKLDGTPLAGGGADYEIHADLVVITDTFLSAELTYVGDSVALVFNFDVGVCVLSIAATGTSPSISPTSATYVFGSSSYVSTTIDWGEATPGTLVVTESGGLLTAGTDYHLFDTELVIDWSWLSTAFTDVGDYITLVLEFSTGAALFTITATGPCPSISPASAAWVCDAANIVTTTIDWGAATPGTLVVDIAGSGAPPMTGGGVHYTLYDTLLVIESGFLSTFIPSAGDVIVLSLEFDACEEAEVLFTITNAGIACPSLSPSSAKYDITVDPSCCYNVTTGIDWCDANNVLSVTDVTSKHAPVPLTLNTDYWVVGDVLKIAGCQTGTAWGGLYCRLDACSRTARVLQVEFDDACNCTALFTIASDGYTSPSLSSTALTYNLDLANDSAYLYVGAVISWGTAAMIKQIDQIDDTGASLCTLTTSPIPNYMVSYVGSYSAYLVLFLKSYYLNKPMNWAGPGSCGADLQACGDSVNLKIYWDPTTPSIAQCGAQIATYPYMYCPTTITITATGTSATISPSKCDLDLDTCCNITTEIDWGPHATDITKITCSAGCGGDELVLGDDYWFDAYVDADTPSTLTISGDYLCGSRDCGCMLNEPGDAMALTIEFDECDPATLTIIAVGPPMCFIATAAYGTPTAGEIDILREFRDTVLLPNGLGAKLVSLYYETSPPIAELISQNEALRTVVRVGLIAPIVAVVDWSQGLWS